MVRMGDVKAEAGWRRRYERRYGGSGMRRWKKREIGAGAFTEADTTCATLEPVAAPVRRAEVSARKPPHEAPWLLLPPGSPGRP